MSKFRGYKIDTTNICRIEAILDDAKKNIAAAAKEEYHRLLSDILNELCTDISLHVIDRPNIPVLDAAVNILNQKITQTENLNLGTEFDLRSGTSIIPDKDDKCIYIIFNAANPLLEDAFAATKGILDFTVEMDESVEHAENERVRKWMKLQKRMQDTPILMHATLTSTIEVDKTLLRFDPKKDRATERARHHLMNRYMQMYSGGQQIQPQDLMRVMDQAMSRLLSETGEADMRMVEAQLMDILTEIDLETVILNPKSAIAEAQQPDTSFSEGTAEAEITTAPLSPATDENTNFSETATTYQSEKEKEYKI